MVIFAWFFDFETSSKEIFGQISIFEVLRIVLKWIIFLSMNKTQHAHLIGLWNSFISNVNIKILILSLSSASMFKLCAGFLPLTFSQINQCTFLVEHVAGSCLPVLSRVCNLLWKVVCISYVTPSSVYHKPIKIL